MRQRELVRCGPSLQQWERQLRTGQSISLHDGSKGGKSRQIFIPPERRDNALRAVQALAELSNAQDGKVVASKTLESACRLVSAQFAKLGLSAENSGHSLRRSFAMDQFKHYMSEGYSQKEALGMASIDLGHGDSRGRWVYNNYLRGTLEGA